MARKSGKAAAKNGGSKPERKKKNGKGSLPKPSAAQISDQDRQALLFSHAKKLKPLLAAKKEAADAVTAAFELAKAEGVTRKDIMLKIDLETQEGVIKLNDELKRIQCVARWSGIGEQLDMFANKVAKETARQRHYEDGRRAALNDQPATAPDHLHQQDLQAWLEGHTAGRNTLNAQRVTFGIRAPGDGGAPEMMPLGEAAAAATSHLGTEPATYSEAQH